MAMRGKVKLAFWHYRVGDVVTYADPLMQRLARAGYIDILADDVEQANVQPQAEQAIKRRRGRPRKIT